MIILDLKEKEVLMFIFKKLEIDAKILIFGLLLIFVGAFLSNGLLVYPLDYENFRNDYFPVGLIISILGLVPYFLGIILLSKIKLREFLKFLGMLFFLLLLYNLLFFLPLFFAQKMRWDLAITTWLSLLSFAILCTIGIQFFKQRKKIL